VATRTREDQIVDEFILLPAVAGVFLERSCDTMNILLSCPSGATDGIGDPICDVRSVPSI
jgi:hypothetical protein